MEFFLKIDDEKMEEIRYLFSGCRYPSACGALVAFYAEGRSAKEAMFI